MRNFTEEEFSILYNAYVEEKRGLKYCSSLVHSTPETVKKELKKRGIHIRTQKEAAIASNKNRALEKDETYFQRESPNMAWILGFLASDGTVGKNNNKIKIGLAAKDVEILYRIKEEMNLPAEPKLYTNNQGYDCCTLQWTCEQHKKDLIKYSIVPAKTFILKPPLELDRKYWIDYIRGYFDGDGSINLIKNGNSRGNGNLRWQVCSATKEILEWIVNFLYEEYNIPKVNIQTERKESGNLLYYIQYSSISTRKIYTVLYSTSSNMYLKRKKEHYEKILSEVKSLYN